MKLKKPKITKKEENELIRKAIEVQKNAYAPITGMKVGASVMTTEGNIYVGVNSQSVISGLGTCAERNAIHNANANGGYNFKALAVYMPVKNGSRPCGACLQIIHEFAEISKTDIKIYVIGKNKKISEILYISELLPKGYGPRESGKDIKEYEKNKDLDIKKRW